MPHDRDELRRIRFQEGLGALQPDVVVLDIRLPDLNGIEVASRLRDAGAPPRIVTLSAFCDKRFVTAMLRAGASAYVTKSAAGTDLICAIRAVVSGKCYFSPDIAALLELTKHAIRQGIVSL
jgi:DNA-binding NarL/FixJ family response regulator